MKHFDPASARGYYLRAMFPPVDFTHCNSAYDTEFDENYAAPGSVVQNPTRLSEMTAYHARRAEVVPGPAQALSRALELATPEDVIFITGSLYLVGELRRVWMSRKGGRPVSF